MVQELGETREAMLKDDDLAVQKILNERPTGHYWIVLHHKPTDRVTTKGQKVIMRLCKAYDQKPRNLLGTVILEIKDGEIIKHDINLHDAPIDWGTVEKHAGIITNPYVQENKDNASAFIYNQ